MNKYEAKLAARKARFQRRAQLARSAADATYAQARALASVIPFGQPILIGHHSERRDRRHRGRIHDKYQRAFELHDQAKQCEARAAKVGAGGVSSDDPAAVTKLREKLTDLERRQEVMKKANALIRAERCDELEGLGLSPAQVAELLKPDFMERVGFPSYALQNNGAEIRRVRERIESLETDAQRQTAEMRCEDIRATFRRDVEENRLMVIFDGKPSLAAREVLKACGFKWSARRLAWIRLWTKAAEASADRVRRELATLEVA